MEWRYLIAPRRVFRSIQLYVAIFGVRGIYWAGFCLFSKSSKLVRVRPGWTRHPLFLRINSSDIPVFKQIFIERQYDIVREMDHDPKDILDGGANIGLTSVFFAEQFPHARIWAVEPESKNFDVLCKNVLKYDRIVCINGALWDRDSAVEVVEPGASEWAFRVGEATSRSTSEKVQGYRVGSLIRRFEIQHLSLLKLDIEGAEFEVFSDYKDWLTKVDNVVVEIHESIRPGSHERFKIAMKSFEFKAANRELVFAARRIGWDALVGHVGR